MLTDLCSASEAGVGLVIKAGGIKVALAALENQSGPNVAVLFISLEVLLRGPISQLLDACLMVNTQMMQSQILVDFYG